jgi:hypothetical protein
MEELGRMLSKYGGWGLLLAVALYILVRADIHFHYPRKNDREK